MRSTLQVLLLVPAFLLGTVGFGWVSVALLGFVWGALNKSDRSVPFTCAASAAVGWGLLLAWTAVQGPVAELALKLGAVVGVHGFVFIFATLVFPAILAGSAAGVGWRVRRMVGLGVWGSGGLRV